MHGLRVPSGQFYAGRRPGAGCEVPVPMQSPCSPHGRDSWSVEVPSHVSTCEPRGCALQGHQTQRLSLFQCVNSFFACFSFKFMTRHSFTFGEHMHHHETQWVSHLLNFIEPKKRNKNQHKTQICQPWILWNPLALRKWTPWAPAWPQRRWRWRGKCNTGTAWPQHLKLVHCGSLCALICRAHFSIFCLRSLRICFSLSIEGVGLGWLRALSGCWRWLELPRSSSQSSQGARFTSLETTQDSRTKHDVWTGETDHPMTCHMVTYDSCLHVCKHRIWYTSLILISKALGPAATCRTLHYWDQSVAQKLRLWHG